MSTSKKAWTVLAAAFLAGVAVTMNQFKVPPLLPTLMTDLHADMVTGGWFMSVFSVAAVLLSIPAAFLLHRLGPKPTGLIALACVALGSSLGALATNATALLLSRIVEGISVSLIAVVAPSLISLWFEPRERGLPMGIWAAWVPVGSVLMFNVAHPLQAAFGWQGVWWFGTVLALAALVIFALLAAVPRRPSQETEPPLPTSALGRGLLDPAGWLLALTFGAFAFSVLSYNTWAPAFLTEVLHVETARANFETSLIFLAGIPANVVAGGIINRLASRQRYRLLSAVLVVTGVLSFWAFRLGTVGVVVPYMLILGFVSNFIPTSLFTLAPETAARPAFVGLILAALNVGSNLGVLVGPPIIGAIVSDGNWAPASTAMAAMMAVGVLASLMAGGFARKRRETA